ncbi:MAG: hypothetical protein OdinLCB4_003715 [Candidatus Odinarchaeum yellowstonii]|uniref:Rubrerythrin diiron-binding domain-containing protein n=1 Tax=Odinarchaeota yellowstonii (strain LCB_4) TaxID=1841599 RepID=A0AAF0IC67_ODILC|nr:MAG: hypothetical protein OdinLCB4_003715 [Candidatus Odinarchaeum yellowstonii]
MIVDKAVLEKFLDEGIRIEEHIVRKSETTIKDVKNPLIKELVLGISLDSKKHANLLQGLKDLLESRTPFIGVEERDTLSKDIKEHIKLEAKAIEEYSKLIDLVDKREMKLILSYLVEDEKRHHQLLKRIEKWIIEAQTYTEEEWWDIMWKDALFHGSPMG